MKKHDPIICFCNTIRQSQIETAITRGCKRLSPLMNATTAGLGQCGGSCRPDLEKILETYLETGQFPEMPRRKAR
jgi:NAD(P)H-nitrite reductase large subunit